MSAKAEVTLKLSTTKFDLVRRALEDYQQSQYESAKDASLEASERRHHGVESLSAKDLIDELK